MRDVEGREPTGRSGDCTVVICTRNRPVHLAQCLEAVLRLGYPSPAVWVIDNAPADGSSRTIAEQYRVSYAVEPIAGLSRARNLGARLATTKLIAYLDDDALPEPRWLSELMEPFEDPAVAAVTGRVAPFAPESSGAADSAGSTFNLATLRVLDRTTRDWFEMAAFGAVGIGANMAVRRDTLLQLGGFDERLGRGTDTLVNGEEYLLFAKMVAADGRIVYTPKAVVRHPAPPLVKRVNMDRGALRSAVHGYVALLWCEFKEHRWSLLKYLAKRSLQIRIWWHPRPATLSAGWPGLRGVLSYGKLLWRSSAPRVHSYQQQGDQGSAPTPAPETAKQTPVGVADYSRPEAVKLDIISAPDAHP